MTTILKVTGTPSFPLAASAALDFTDDEVDEVSLVPLRDQVQSFSQQGDLTIYNQGPPHWVLRVTFVIDTFETMLKLSEMRDHDAPLYLFPSFRDDPTRRFEVLWTNPNDFLERLKRGWVLLGHAFTADFREPLGDACRPPSVTS